MPLMDGKAKEEGITAKDVDPKQLAKGIKTEGEHTKVPWMAKAITLDHLAEDPQYYTHLAEMEKKYKAAYARGYTLAMIKRAGLGDWVREHPRTAAYGDPLGILFPAYMAPKDEGLKTQLLAMAGSTLGGAPGTMLAAGAMAPIERELSVATSHLPAPMTRAWAAAKALSGKDKAKAVIGTILGAVGAGEANYQLIAPHSALNDWRASRKGIIDRVRHHFA